MKRDKFYQRGGNTPYTADEKLYEELLDRACTNDVEVMEACIEEILDTISWQERNEMILSSFPRGKRELTEEQISFALNNNWVTDNTLN